MRDGTNGCLSTSSELRAECSSSAAVEAIVRERDNGCLSTSSELRAERSSSAAVEAIVRDGTTSGTRPQR